MLLLKRSEISDLLSLEEYVHAVEQAFKSRAEGGTLSTGMVHIEAPEGEFHIKAGGLGGDRKYVGVKVNGGFFQNAIRYGMPNIQGAIYLASAENGLPLALMDSIEITRKRTGAATVVAAKYLSRLDSRVATICGCGTQGRIQLQALKHFIPFQHVYAFSRSHERAQTFADQMTEELGVSVTATQDLKAAIAESDVVVTCTPAKQLFLKREYVCPGTFVAAVGSDSPEKHELEPSLLASSKVVVDILEQCTRVGELHHAIEEGLMKESDVHSELGDIIAGRKPGRTNDQEITIYDSTGTALQDVAVAAAIYEKAIKMGRGMEFPLAE